MHVRRALLTCVSSSRTVSSPSSVSRCCTCWGRRGPQPRSQAGAPLWGPWQGVTALEARNRAQLVNLESIHSLGALA
jgi:hypothetical protein